MSDEVRLELVVSSLPVPAERSPNHPVWEVYELMRTARLNRLSRVAPKI